jgi:hypothetical protein
MTKALEEAFQEASKLPEAEQNALDEAIKAEIGAEGAWDNAFARSRDILGRLADEALADHRAGRTKPLDPRRGDLSRERAILGGVQGATGARPGEGPTGLPPLPPGPLPSQPSAQTNTSDTTNLFRAHRSGLPGPRPS